MSGSDAAEHSYPQSMFIDIRPSGEAATADLLDEGNFQEFHVSAPHEASADVVNDALRTSGAGALGEDGDAMISVDWLLDRGPQEDAWRDSFGAMLRYAKSKGWVDDAEACIRAHLKRHEDPMLHQDGQRRR